MVSLALDPYWTIALALLLDAAIGHPRWRAQAASAVRGWATGVIDGMNRKLNRPARPPGDRRIRGAIACLALLGLVGILGALLEALLASGPYILKVLLVATFFAQRRSFDQARMALKAAEEATDPFAVRRAAAARLARNLAVDVAGPALAYALFGLTGLFVYGGVLLLGGRYQADLTFGGLALLCKRWALAAALLPAAAAILIASAFAPAATPGRALKTVWRGGPQAPDAVTWPLAAMAGALDLSFEGRQGWIGGGRAKIEAADLKRALYLFALACLFHLTAWTALGFLNAV